MHWQFWQPPCLLRTVVVNLKGDPTTAIRGVLWSTRGGWFVLRQASVSTSGDVAPADGDLIVHRSNVAFLQVLEP